VPLLVKACLNGGTTREEHPAVPITPAELAADAEAARAAGAGAVHLHARAAEGTETLAPDAVDAAVAAVRQACPGLPVGVTTGIWASGGDVDARTAAVQAWTDLPDFASVNFSEPGPEALSELLLARGIGVEAGIWTVTDAQRLAGSGLAGRCLRVLIEPQEHRPAGALSNAGAIRSALADAGVDRPLIVHGYGPAAWPVLEAALNDGRGVRIGLEDTTTLRDGRQAAGNAELVAAAVALVRDREV
jgi:uncharacterized protein (DUF849 family)